MRAATLFFATLAKLGSGYRDWTARFVASVGGIGRFVGCSGGAVMTELFYPGGARRRAVLFSDRDAQRMAALPAAIVAERLSSGAPVEPGAFAGCEVLPARALIDLVGAGYQLQIDA